MRKELYQAIKHRLSRLCQNAAGEYYMAPEDMDTDIVNPIIKHMDLWNRNLEFIEQERAWERPAVFIEFSPIRWNAIVPGIEYRAEPQIILHVVTEWTDAAGDEASNGIDMLDLADRIHDALGGLRGKSFMDLSLSESQTNHNHEEIVENIEIYDYVAFKSVGH